MLDLQQKRYEAGEKHLSGFDMINELTKLKHDGEHDWLNEISAISINTICRDLDSAYKNFFKKQCTTECSAFSNQYCTIKYSIFSNQHCMPECSAFLKFIFYS